MKGILALLLVLALVVGPAPRAEAAGEVPAFRGKLERIDAETRARMSGVSWRSGCPVGFADLRLLRVRHWGFDGRVHYGRLVVNRRAARGMLAVMASLYRQRFPIHRDDAVVAAFAAIGREWGRQLGLAQGLPALLGDRELSPGRGSCVLRGGRR